MSSSRLEVNNLTVPIPQEQPVVAGSTANLSNGSGGHVVINGVKREHEHEVVMTLAGLFKVRNILQGDPSGCAKPIVDIDVKVAF